MNIKNNLTELIGKTPLLYLSGYCANNNISAKIVGKLELFNPMGSIKDRVAYAMICSAENGGELSEGSVVVEATSGNTGIGLAFVCAAKGYRLILTMPETMSVERRNLLTALGAEIVLTEGALGMKGALAKADEICAQLPKSFMPKQFDNPANVKIHSATTANEIIMDTDGRVDIFVAGFGTGGTITGVGTVLRQNNPDVKIIGVEPKESPVLSQGKAGKHGIQGIGAGFIPSILNPEVIDEVVSVATEEAYKTTKELIHSDGLMVGISSGAAVFAASEIARRPENKDKLIVVILPDSGERYLSTGVYTPKKAT